MDTLLIVDDELSILKSIERLFLGDESIHVLTANSAMEAKKMVASEHVDIIISDERMPQISGTVFLEFIKEHYPQIQRIILTGYADQQATIRAINNAEVFRFLLKPWEPADLIGAVKNALEIKQLRESKQALDDQVQHQNAQLEHLNKHLEHTVAERTLQLRKSYELLKKQHEALKLQQSGTIELLTSLLSLFDPARSRQSKLIARHWQLMMADGQLQLSDDGLSAAMISVMVLSDADNFLDMLASIPGFGSMAQLLELSIENFDGTGPQGKAGATIPLDSRLLRIIHDYHTLHPNHSERSIQLLRLQKGLLYDPLLVDAFLAKVSHDFNDACIEVRIEDLKPGMVLGKDLVLTNGALLLPDTTELTESIILQLGKLRQFMNTSMYIQAPTAG